MRKLSLKEVSNEWERRGCCIHLTWVTERGRKEMRQELDRKWQSLLPNQTSMWNMWVWGSTQINQHTHTNIPRDVCVHGGLIHFHSVTINTDTFYPLMLCERTSLKGVYFSQYTYIFSTSIETHTHRCRLYKMSLSFTQTQFIECLPLFVHMFSESHAIVQSFAGSCLLIW